MENTDNIRYTGLNDLSPSNQMYLQKYADRHIKNILRKTKMATSLRILVKSYDNEGTRRKYVIDVTTVLPEKKNFRAEKDDYQFEVAVKKVFDALEFEIGHKLHSDEQQKGRDIMRRRKRYSKSE